MAISLTTINGTDSIAASRITLNDNFSTVKSAIDDIQSVVNSTGAIDNSSKGSPTIQTGSITVTGANGVTISTGSLSVTAGNITLGGTLSFGTGATIKRTNKTISSVSTPILDVAGATGATFTGTVGYFVIPRQTTAAIKSTVNPELGALVYNTDINTLVYCAGTTSATGGTGQWYRIATGATALI